jgi:hypothetical protein
VNRRVISRRRFNKSSCLEPQSSGPNCPDWVNLHCVSVSDSVLDTYGLNSDLVAAILNDGLRVFRERVQGRRMLKWWRSISFMPLTVRNTPLSTTCPQLLVQYRNVNRISYELMWPGSVKLLMGSCASAGPAVVFRVCPAAWPVTVAVTRCTKFCGDSRQGRVCLRTLTSGLGGTGSRAHLGMLKSEL